MTKRGMLGLDESLKELNAVLEEEIDINNSPKYYLKIRLFPSRELCSSFASEDLKVVSFTDEFYDLPNFENIKNQSNIRFYRKRINENGNESKLVKQSARTLNNRSHVYVEEILSDKEILKTMQMYLSFRFDRIYYGEEHGVVSMYLDKISAPFDYHVLSCRILIKEDINLLTDKKIQDLVKEYFPEKGLPVYTKFAYMLQCSSHFYLYETLSPEDKVYNRMKEKMVGRDYLEFQEYLWTFDRILQFQSIFDVFKNYDETVERVGKLEKQFQKGLFTVNIAEDKDIEDYI